MRVLCLDIGLQRIGVAVSDELGVSAQGVGVILRKSFSSDIEQIKEHIEKYRVESIVLGYPVKLNGSKGALAREVHSFAAALKEKSKLSVELWDERFSTAAAERALLEGNLSRKKRKKIIDKISAVIILESYLEAKRK